MKTFEELSPELIVRAGDKFHQDGHLNRGKKLREIGSKKMCEVKREKYKGFGKLKIINKNLDYISEIPNNSPEFEGYDYFLDLNESVMITYFRQYGSVNRVLQLVFDINVIPTEKMIENIYNVSPKNNDMEIQSRSKGYITVSKFYIELILDTKQTKVVSISNRIDRITTTTNTFKDRSTVMKLRNTILNIIMMQSNLPSRYDHLLISQQFQQFLDDIDLLTEYGIDHMDIAKAIKAWPINTLYID
jgi:hypothetical protein